MNQEQARRALELEELCAQKVRTHCKECNSAWDARYGRCQHCGWPSQ